MDRNPLWKVFRNIVGVVDLKNVWSLDLLSWFLCAAKGFIYLRFLIYCTIPHSVSHSLSLGKIGEPFILGKAGASLVAA